VVSADDIEMCFKSLMPRTFRSPTLKKRLIEQAAALATDDDDDSLDEDVELDLSAGALEKTNDPVRLYLREMGVVPLLTARAKFLSPKESNATDQDAEIYFPMPNRCRRTDSHGRFPGKPVP